MKFIALNGPSDRLRPFPHVLCKSCPLFLSLSTRFDEIREKIGWLDAKEFHALAELKEFRRRKSAMPRGRLIGEDLPVADVYYAVCKLRDICLMRDQHDGVAAGVKRIE